MNKVYACIDGLANTTAVVDWAAWSAQRLDVPLEFLHVLERDPGRDTVSDYSGAIGLGAQEAGRQLLAAARARAEAAGVARLDARLRHGELVDSVLEMQADARLFVLGGRDSAQQAASLFLDHHVEQVIRSVRRPVLVASAGAFLAPSSFVMAFDGSDTARQTVTTVARSPLLSGLPVLLAMAGEDEPLGRAQLEAARTELLQAGFTVEVALVPGEPEQVLPALVKAQGAALLVMGAHGHSRIRQLIVGSTTTNLLRLSEVPVLILR